MALKVPSLEGLQPGGDQITFITREAASEGEGTAVEAGGNRPAWSPGLQEKAVFQGGNWHSFVL
jgi:hypothetical protein